MPIPLPNLDDRSYADLTTDARALIPSLQPAWTNHNPSDPGITLVELLAWLTEMLLFQVNEIPDASTERFLTLLNGPTWTRPQSMSLGAAVRQTVLDLRERYRAVTGEDYEWLTLHAWPRSDAAVRLGSGGKVRRVRCIPRRDLSAADPAARRAPSPAHVSLVVVPEPASSVERQRQRIPIRLPFTLRNRPAEDAPQPTDELLAELWTFFDARRTLATRHHVVGPDYLPVEISANLALHEDAPPAEALAAARAALARFFHPLTGGPERTGWPFGRAVYVSEVYAELERVALVSYVEDVQVSTSAGESRVQIDEADRVVGIELEAHELVRLAATELTAYDVYGRRYR
jgi:hypothetical protein